MRRLLARKQTILLVEDDSGLADLIVSHLPPSRWSVAVARTSEAALSLIRNAATPYNYAILDVWLPQDDSGSAQPFVGYLLAEQIGTLSPKTKIIGMSQFIDASSALRTSGRFFGFIEKSALIAEPLATLERCLQSGGTGVPAQTSTSGVPQPQLVLRHRQSWLFVACMSGLVAAALPLILALVGSGLLRLCLVAGLIVFLLVLLLNPHRRYFNSFTTILGVWASSTFIPALGVHVDSPKLLVSFFTQGPGAAFHLSSVLLMIVLLILDWKTRESRAVLEDERGANNGPNRTVAPRGRGSTSG
jgi:CheY-like chemotaxis protein